jgi:hypothetical protein
MVKTLVRDLGFDQQPPKNFITATISREIGSTTELTLAEASAVIQALQEAKGDSE